MTKYYFGQNCKYFQEKKNVIQYIVTVIKDKKYCGKLRKCWLPAVVLIQQCFPALLKLWVL